MFFELLLAASYGLALYGSGTPRVRASLHYIVINLTASLFFLVGVSLLYGVTGTLNMADLALRIPAVDAADRVLVEGRGGARDRVPGEGRDVAALLLAALHLRRGQRPAAALFSILSKVGLYAVLRLWLLGAGVGGELLLYGGMATSPSASSACLPPRSSAAAGYSLLVSSGTLLTAIGIGNAAVTGAALYYLVVSTLGIAALFLLIELVQRPAARAPTCWR